MTSLHIVVLSCIKYLLFVDNLSSHGQCTPLLTRTLRTELRVERDARPLTSTFADDTATRWKVSPDGRVECLQAPNSNTMAHQNPPITQPSSPNRNVNLIFGSL